MDELSSVQVEPIVINMKMSATFHVRSSFTPTFFVSAANLTRLAGEIESTGTNVSRDDQLHHKGYVAGAILQATAGLEAAISEVLMHGPTHSIGSATVGEEKSALLKTFAEVIDSAKALDRYNLTLRLLGYSQFDPSAQPYQDADLIVRLRNELVHYRSHWSDGDKVVRTDDRAAAKKNLLAGLSNKRFAKPPFVADGSVFFPHRCLSSACARWAVDRCVAFHDDFYSRLGIPSPLDPYRELLIT